MNSGDDSADNGWNELQSSLHVNQNNVVNGGGINPGGGGGGDLSPIIEEQNQQQLQVQEQQQQQQQLQGYYDSDGNWISGYYDESGNWIEQSGNTDRTGNEEGETTGRTGGGGGAGSQSEGENQSQQQNQQSKLQSSSDGGNPDRDTSTNDSSSPGDESYFTDAQVKTFLRSNLDSTENENVYPVEHDTSPALYLILAEALKSGPLPKDWIIVESSTTEQESSSQVYFYNTKTEQTSWDLPEPFRESFEDVFPNFAYVWSENGYFAHADTENHDQECSERLQLVIQGWLGSMEKELFGSTDSATDQQVQQPEWQGWTEHYTEDNGDKYFYNEITNVTSWEDPRDKYQSEVLGPKLTALRRLEDREFRDYVRQYEAYYCPQKVEEEWNQKEKENLTEKVNTQSSDTDADNMAAAKPAVPPISIFSQSQPSRPLQEIAKEILESHDRGLKLSKWMQPDQYAKYLQISSKKEKELYSIFEPLFLMPLMAPWQAKRDDKSRVYFQHVGALPVSKKVWKHPLQSFFQEIIKEVRDILDIQINGEGGTSIEDGISDRKAKLVAVMQRHAGRKSLKGVGSWLEIHGKDGIEEELGYNISEIRKKLEGDDGAIGIFEKTQLGKNLLSMNNLNDSDSETNLPVIYIHREEKDLKRWDSPAVAACVQVYTKLNMLTKIWSEIFDVQEHKCPLSDEDCWGLAERLGNMVITGATGRTNTLVTSERDGDKSQRSATDVKKTESESHAKKESQSKDSKDKTNDRSDSKDTITKANPAPDIKVDTQQAENTKSMEAQALQSANETPSIASMMNKQQSTSSRLPSKGQAPLKPPPAPNAISTHSPRPGASPRPNTHTSSESDQQQKKMYQELLKRQQELESTMEIKLSELQSMTKLIETQAQTANKTALSVQAKQYESNQILQINNANLSEQEKKILEEKIQQEKDREQSDYVRLLEKQQKLEMEMLHCEKYMKRQQELEANVEKIMELENFDQKLEKMRSDLKKDQEKIQTGLKSLVEKEIMVHGLVDQSNGDGTANPVKIKSLIAEETKSLEQRLNSLNELMNKKLKNLDQIHISESEKEGSKKEIKEGALEEVSESDNEGQINDFVLREVKSEFLKVRKQAEDEWKESFSRERDIIESNWIKKMEDKRSQAELELQKLLSDMKDKFQQEHKQLIDQRRKDEEIRLEEQRVRSKLENLQDKGNMSSEAAKMMIDHHQKFEKDFEQKKIELERDFRERQKIVEELVQKKKQEVSNDIELFQQDLQRDLHSKTQSLENDVVERCREHFEKLFGIFNNKMSASTEEIQKKIFQDAKRRQQTLLEELETDAKNRQERVIHDRSVIHSRLQVEADGLEELRKKAEIERHRLEALLNHEAVAAQVVLRTATTLSGEDSDKNGINGHNNGGPKTDYERKRQHDLVSHRIESPTSVLPGEPGTVSPTMLTPHSRKIEQLETRLKNMEQLAIEREKEIKMIQQMNGNNIGSLGHNVNHNHNLNHNLSNSVLSKISDNSTTQTNMNNLDASSDHTQGHNPHPFNDSRHWTQLKVGGSGQSHNHSSNASGEDSTATFGNHMKHNHHLNQHNHNNPHIANGNNKQINNFFKGPGPGQQQHMNHLNLPGHPHTNQHTGHPHPHPNHPPHPNGSPHSAHGDTEMRQILTEMRQQMEVLSEVVKHGKDERMNQMGIMGLSPGPAPHSALLQTPPRLGTGLSVTGHGHHHHNIHHRPLIAGPVVGTGLGNFHPSASGPVPGVPSLVQNHAQAHNLHMQQQHEIQQLRNELNLTNFHNQNNQFQNQMPNQIQNHTQLGSPVDRALDESIRNVVSGVLEEMNNSGRRNRDNRDNRDQRDRDRSNRPNTGTSGSGRPRSASRRRNQNSPPGTGGGGNSGTNNSSRHNTSRSDGTNRQNSNNQNQNVHSSATNTPHKHSGPGSARRNQPVVSNISNNNSNSRPGSARRSNGNHGNSNNRPGTGGGGGGDRSPMSASNIQRLQNRYPDTYRVFMAADGGRWRSGGKRAV